MISSQLLVSTLCFHASLSSTLRIRAVYILGPPPFGTRKVHSPNPCLCGPKVFATSSLRAWEAARHFHPLPPSLCSRNKNIKMFGFLSLIIFFFKKKNEAEPNIGVMIAYDYVHSNKKGSAAGK